MVCTCVFVFMGALMHPDENQDIFGTEEQCPSDLVGLAFDYFSLFLRLLHRHLDIPSVYMQGWNCSSQEIK